MRMLCVLSLFVGGLFCATTAWGGIVLSVDLDPIAPGIQSSRSYDVGASVQASLVLEVTAPTRLAQFSYSVRYDPSALTFVSRAETPSVIPGWAEINALDGSANGLLFNFDGLGPTLIGPQGPFVVASIMFTAAAPTVGPGAGLIEVGLFNPNAGVDGFAGDAPPFIVPSSELSFRSASVTVPEPTTACFSLFALTFCLRLRGRRTK